MLKKKHSTSWHKCLFPCKFSPLKKKLRFHIETNGSVPTVVKNVIAVQIIGPCGEIGSSIGLLKLVRTGLWPVISS